MPRSSLLYMDWICFVNCRKALIQLPTLDPNHNNVPMLANVHSLTELVKVRVSPKVSDGLVFEEALCKKKKLRCLRISTTTTRCSLWTMAVSIRRNRKERLWKPILLVSLRCDFVVEILWFEPHRRDYSFNKATLHSILCQIETFLRKRPFHCTWNLG